MLKEDPYRELVECQQDLIVKFNPGGRLLYVNPSYCETVGKTREELVGSVFMPATDERQTEVVATQMIRLFRPPFTCVVEQWIPTTHGLRCFSWSAKSILDSNGTVGAIVATGRDVTLQKMDRRATKKKDEDLMLVVESGQQMYYSHTPDNVLQYVSPRIRVLLGCRARSGRRLWTDYLSDHHENARGLERTQRAIGSCRREPPYRLEFSGKDGARIWVEVNEIPVVKNGKTVAIAGSLVDITERMHIDEGINEAEQLFKWKGRASPPEEPENKPRFGFLRTILSKENEDT
ncbi:MAG: hypothetical protein STSR0009_00050 [Methanoregula sp.]